jgi:hypothetical protein
VGRGPSASFQVRSGETGAGKSRSQGRQAILILRLAWLLQRDLVDAERFTPDEIDALIGRHQAGVRPKSRRPRNENDGRCDDRSTW